MSHAQQLRHDDILNGFSEFVLGSDKKYFGDRIRFVDSLKFKGNTEYHYIYRFSTQYELGGVQFPEVSLTFDKYLKLKEIELRKAYSAELFSDHQSKAYHDNRALYDYLVKQTGQKGKKKSRFNTLKAPGYEWQKGEKRLWTYLQTTTYPGNKGKIMYFIELSWGNKNI